MIDSILKIDYPADKLTIQILDDSTDDTVSIVQEHLEKIKNQGFRIEHIRHEKREGYKAGALDYGFSLNQSPFVAIFDADFRPSSDFLKKTIPFFEDKEIGVVQTRWGHLNETKSLLTRAQTIMLDAHFGVEQLGRLSAGGFINFNGTAGIWRRSCIEDAGGWQADTLTEDLDLSFRAQAKHWKFEFLRDVVSPAELPTSYGACRNHQFRWSKGAAECFRKNIKLLWTAPVSIGAKVIGTFHLLNSSVYVLVLLLTAFAPFIFFLSVNGELNNFEWIPLIGTSINLMLLIVFLGGKLICAGFSWRTLLWFIPSLFFFFSMSIGISLHMVMGVIEGYRGKKTPFIRTPKFGSIMKDKLTGDYQQKARYNLKLIEFAFFGYGFFWLIIGLRDMNPFVLVYSFILITGFSLALFGDTKFRKRPGAKLEPSGFQV